MARKKGLYKFYWEDATAQPEKPAPFRTRQTKETIVVTAELPGFRRNEISLHVTENAMEISATKKEQRMEKGHGYVVAERSLGSVKRAFSLPATVDPSRVEARYEGGVLTVIMEKQKKSVK